MKVTLESTEKIVTLDLDGQQVPARVWQGETANGIPCHAFVTRIGHDENDDATEFEADLQEHAAPRPEVEALPLKLFIG